MQKVVNIKPVRTVGATADKVRSEPLASPRLIENPVDESLKSVSPAWPLQNSVAVNPFWFNRDRHITDVFSELSPVLNQYLFMPLSFYQEKYRNGEISQFAVATALLKARKKWPQLPADADTFHSLTHDSDASVNAIKTAAEAIPDTIDFHRKIIEDIGKYCAAYFDDNQALARYPWQSGSFWSGWKEAQRFDKTIQMLGLNGFSDTVRMFADKSPEESIAFIFAELGLTSPHAQYGYAQKLLVSMIGWASQFKYLEWQKSLGYDVPRHSTLIDFLAVRMIYDFSYFRYQQRKHKSQAHAWVTNLWEASRIPAVPPLRFAQHYVWQMAFELTAQQRTANGLNKSQNLDKQSAKYQMVFCIDVRSEMIRRHIEHVDSGIQTMGFAGFFGAPIDYKKIDEKQAGHRLPVLLSPAFQVNETTKNTASTAHSHPAITKTLVFSYFRNLRKASIGSFLYVEIFGILALGNLIASAVKSAVARLRGASPISRFAPQKHRTAVCMDESRHNLSLAQRAERAKGILTHLGLRDGFGRLVVICGHGAQTTNNALASALDCGACGGHAGDANARFVAQLLNQQDVRTQLIEESIVIPDETRFVAAVHETVTDSIVFLDEDEFPQEYAPDLAHLKAQLAAASTNTIGERNTARSDALDTNPHRRAESWAEIRPEWGLAGNAHFVVAPRTRTIGVNLSSRAFLHDYNWKNDVDFQTLELIMTAPMVVTNWINLQYYGSVVAPDYFGSGNKILHNVTGENGVIEGNGGDLRIGLAKQSVHDGSQFTHEPLRLSVYIEAPREAIEEIIDKHKVVKDLIDNEWLYLLHIDPETLSVHRRRPDGAYELV